MASRKRILEELDRLEPRVARAFRDAVDRIRSRVRISALEDAIRAGDIGRAAAVAGISRSVWALVTESVRGVYIEGGTFQADEAPARLGFAFDVNNPRAENWLRNHSSEFVTRINEETREAIRRAVAFGAERGVNPRTTALDIVGRIDRNTGKRTGSLIGLTQQQSDAVLDMKAALSSDNGIGVVKVKRDGTPVKGFWIQNDGSLGSKYSKRDRRFDGIVKRAIEEDKPLSSQDINRLSGRYSDRLLKLRGDNIARTETLQAFNKGADEALRQAADEGLIKDIVRVWDAAGDARTRPEHMSAEGQRRGLNEPFRVGGRSMMHPGDPAGGAANVINCRCVLRTEVEWGEA